MVLPGRLGGRVGRRPLFLRKAPSGESGRGLLRSWGRVCALRSGTVARVLAEPGYDGATGSRS